jgi:hypothetical protein
MLQPWSSHEIWPTSVCLYARHMILNASLIHRLIEIVVYLLRLLIDHCPSLVNNLNLFALFTPNSYLQALFLLSDIVNLLFQVNYQSLYSVYQMIFTLKLQIQLLFFLLKVFLILLYVLDITSNNNDVLRNVLISIGL